MLPKFIPSGNLPPGIHWATWQEFAERFGSTPHRKRLLEGLRIALESLRTAGCKTVYVNGSFVTTKEVPGDFDACWDPDGVEIDRLFKIEPVLFSFENKRAAQQARFKGELFPATERASLFLDGTFLDFFQADRDGNRKGIIAFRFTEFAP